MADLSALWSVDLPDFLVFILPWKDAKAVLHTNCGG
jgi:hypothetical protein